MVRRAGTCDSFAQRFGCEITGMRVNADGFIVVTAEFSAAGAVEASIAVEPEGTYAGAVSTGDTHLASTASSGNVSDAVIAGLQFIAGIRRSVIRSTALGRRQRNATDGAGILVTVGRRK